MSWEATIGLGDNLLGTGMARGAAERGKKIAFGDGKTIIWDHHSRMIFKDNPNIAQPSYRGPDIEWVDFYRGNRIYNTWGGDRWIWNYDFKPTPGEIFFSKDEIRFGDQFGRGYVVVEPNVPAFKSVAPNKQWPVDRYEVVAARLVSKGYRVVQFAYGGLNKVKSATVIHTPGFRLALAVMSRASLYIGPEGGMHHGAAAVGVPGVVMFGGFIPPQVTGYDIHTNLTGGAEACGMTKPCAHCRAAMEAISVDEVVTAAVSRLRAAA